MAEITRDELRKEITAILKDADLTSMSSKKVRQQIETKLDLDLTERKKEIDDMVMECLAEKQEAAGKKPKKKAASESEDGEEEEEEEASEEEEEEEKKPAKRGPPKKAANKRKKGSSDDDESASDEDASDEEYSPKKAKPGKRGKAAKKGKKGKGDDSDSGDSDWAQAKSAKKTGAAKKTGGAKAGGGKGSGYTREITLTPELAAVVGAKKMARYEVVKKVWSIIKEKNLYDPKNKQYAICDDDLLKVIGVKRFRTFGMMKYLKNHFVD